MKLSVIGTMPVRADSTTGLEHSRFVSVPEFPPPRHAAGRGIEMLDMEGAEGICDPAGGCDHDR